MAGREEYKTLPSSTWQSKVERDDTDVLWLVICGEAAVGVLGVVVEVGVVVVVLPPMLTKFSYT